MPSTYRQEILIIISMDPGRTQHPAEVSERPGTMQVSKPMEALDSYSPGDVDAVRPEDSSEGTDRDGDEPRNMWVSLVQSNADSTDQSRRTAKTAETVSAAIVHDIVSRRLAPGDMLPSEAVMLAQYRVSRASLREGLRLLEVQGLIRLKPGPGGGPIVGAVDPRTLAQISTLYLHLGGATYRELFDAHLLIAPMGASLAARNPDRALVRRILRPFLDEDQPLEGQAYWTATNSFHGSVEELGANRVFELMSRVIGAIWHEHVVTRMDTTGLREAIHEEHREIAKAIIAGQPAKAGRLMHDHFQSLMDEYRRHWPGRVNELIEWR
jgi:GntR family transcriptional repressor for pyruvate dehydrogenase complex